MAKKKRQTTRKKKGAEVPLEHDSTTGDVCEQPSQQQVFVEDESFKSALGGLADPSQSNVIDQSVSTAPGKLPPISIRHKRLSNIQKILIGCIVLIATILLYVLLRPLSKPTRKSAGRLPAQIPVLQEPTRPRRKASIEYSAQKRPPQIQESEATPAPATGARPTEGLSLTIAETFYLQKDFDKAYAAYNQLRKSIDEKDQQMRDFLQLKMALCMRNAGDFDQAAQIFRMVSKSRCPVVRAAANYHLSLLEMQKEQYLNAQTRAYQTIALTSALTFDWQWTLSLQQNCNFLIAESMTRHVLSLCDADKDMPAELWSRIPELDPFINLSETELRCLLNTGSEKLRGAVLSPQIEKVDHQFSRVRWSVICYGASIEELLARFAANADLDIQWACNSSPAWEVEKDTLRKRPVSLYMSATTTQQFVTVAAGCVGLLARLDAPRFRGDKLAPAEAGETVKIFNPFDYSSLSEHTDLLTQQAVSLWQTFLLTSGDNERIAAEDGLDPVQSSALAHFALGLLQAQRGNLTDAIAEYKLVANRYPRTSSAPYALLASSKLKVELHDYLGAREDLKQLIEQYPDTKPDEIGFDPVRGSALADQACLYLADVTMKAGLLSEAARLYRKVYNLGFALESKRASALGAGKCFYEEKDYENAAKWLTRYINLSEDHTDRDFYVACFLLGKTYLAQDLPQQACNAFKSALDGLTGQLVVQEYVETVSALVKAHLQQGHFVEALKLLENTNSWQFSQKESVEILLLKVSVLRSMGLDDEAIAVLGDKAEYLFDPQLKAKISFERAKCSIAKGNLELARKNLSEILVLVEPGPLAHEVGCELADVCLKLGQYPQTISICLQLLDSALKAQIKQRVLNLLATAYARQKNFDQAALALLGQWNQAESTKTKGSPPLAEYR